MGQLKSETFEPYYQIFDSMDRVASAPADRAQDLYAECDLMNYEAQEEGDTTTYAIGKVLPNGDVTFDY